MDAVTAWATVAYAALTLGVLVVLGVAAFVGLRQLHSAEKSHKAHVLADISRRWDDELLGEARHQAHAYEGRPDSLAADLSRFEQENSRQYIILKRIPNFFEDLAILVKEDAVSLELVERSLGALINYYWELYRPFVRAERRKDQTFHVHFGWLADEVDRLRRC